MKIQIIIHGIKCSVQIKFSYDIILKKKIICYIKCKERM